MPAQGVELSEGSATDARTFHEDHGASSTLAAGCPSSSSTRGPRCPPPPAGVESPAGDSRAGCQPGVGGRGQGARRM